MKIAIGADHGGYELKESLIKFLKKKGHMVKDFGTFSKEPCDYPPIGYKVARSIGKGLYKRGILVCKTGIGMAIVANKARAARAALCDRVDIARSSREHNDANVLVFAANIVSASQARKITSVWLSTKATGGRHSRRVRQIKNIDKGKGF